MSLPVPSTHLPERVSRFISDYIPSIERLEILLLLSETRTQAWSIDDIEEHIRSSRESVTKNVDALVAAHVLTAREGSPLRYQYAEGAPAGDEIISELANSYRTHRVAVIEQIYSERRDSIRSFSNAFKLGRPHDR